MVMSLVTLFTIIVQVVDLDWSNKIILLWSNMRPQSPVGYSTIGYTETSSLGRSIFDTPNIGYETLILLSFYHSSKRNYSYQHYHQPHVWLFWMFDCLEGM